MIQNPFNKGEIAKFDNIECWDYPTLSDEDVKTLNTDQQRLYLKAWAVIKGECDQRLAQLKSGNVTSARWLTTGILYFFFTQGWIWFVGYVHK